MTVCFIDHDYRVTPAEQEEWSTILAMPAPCMPAAREAFRRVHDGNPPGLPLSLSQFEPASMTAPCWHDWRQRSRGWRQR